jgi:Cdc6-like AAA superfamily ATPase
VNCWEDYSRYKVLYRILEGLDQTFDIHRQSTPTDVLLDRLRDYTGPPYVVILDEVDQLDNTDILYELYRVRGLSMVLIANDEDEFFSRLGGRVASRFQTSARIHFTHYSQQELLSILSDWVRWGLRKDKVTDAQLEQIASAAGGDARVAIGILRVAARHAAQNGMDTLTESGIAEAVSEAKTEIRQQTLEKLTTDQTILHDIITEHDEIAPGELYDEYEERASNPRSQRMVRNYLTKLCHYNLIEADGENRGRIYRAV